MFKLIGLAVVAAVIFWGFDSIQKWYVGDATPQEAVGEVRKVVGEKIMGSETPSQSEPQKSSAAHSAGQDASQPKKPLDTDEMLKRMMKD